MSSEYDVTIFQPTGAECTCLPNCESCSCFNDIDEETVAYNLLARTPATDEGQGYCVKLKPFIPWFDSSSLVSLEFKAKPPKISKSSLQAISEKCDETQDSSTGSVLQEFCPIYQRSLNCHGGTKEYFVKGKETAAVSVSSAIQTSSHRHLTGSRDSLSPSVVQQRELVWCAAPKIKHRTVKAKDMTLWSFKETNLEELKILHKISYWQRGKWIIKETRKSNRARFLTIGELWTKVCHFMKQGHLPHCNARYKKTNLEVWLYCDFIHSLKVRSILENGLGNVGVFSYCIHPQGIIMTL